MSRIDVVTQEKTNGMDAAAMLEPMTLTSSMMMLMLVAFWGANAIAVKVVVHYVPPLWTAFIRFGCTLPFIIPLVYKSKAHIAISTLREGRQLFVLGLLMASQIYCLHLGSKYTTAGRVALFTFSFPVIVPFLSPLLIPSIRLDKGKIVGSAISLLGLAYALREKALVGGLSTIKGDIIEIAGSFLLASMMVYNKRLVITINKWKVIFWQFFFATVLFLAGALNLEAGIPMTFNGTVFVGFAYQILIIGVLCWLLMQHLISRHDASSIAVYFFMTPIFGVTFGALLLKERLDPGIIVGSILVALGIYLVERQKKTQSSV